MKIECLKDGPCLIVLDIPIELDGKELEKVALCRCGASSHKPFCDGTHTAIKFEAEEKIIADE